MIKEAAMPVKAWLLSILRKIFLIPEVRRYPEKGSPGAVLARCRNGETPFTERLPSRRVSKMLVCDQFPVLLLDDLNHRLGENRPLGGGCLNVVFAWVRQHERHSHGIPCCIDRLFVDHPPLLLLM